MTVVVEVAEAELTVPQEWTAEFVEMRRTEAYEAPSVADWDESDEKETWIWFIVLVGFLYVATLYWADRCRQNGGWPVTRFYWYKGYEVTCNR